MIGRNHITANAIVLASNNVEPFVNFRKEISDGKKIEPSGAGEGAEIKFITLIFDCFNRHCVKVKNFQLLKRMRLRVLRSRS